ncbi:MAG: NAD(P)-dependent oxidoreductase [Rhodospirillales bacterium]|nr:NAD(P)-dependent oxidoreductase [Rhodospirillales bacterium]
MSLNIGTIGLGIMGSAMSGHLLKKGFKVFGTDIDPAKVSAFEKNGGEAVSSPQAVADKSDVIITSLPTIAAVDEVFLGENGLLSSAKAGLIVLETSTMPIEVKQRAHDALAEVGIIMLDCPLSGTGAQAAAGDLSIYASGDEKAYETCIPVFQGFGRSNYYVGEFGNGSKMKYVANLLVAIHNVSAAEAFVLGMKSGLDADMIYKVIKDGAGNSRMFEIRGPMMVENSYEPATMTMEMWKKDMDIITGYADTIGSPTPLLSACNPIYTAARSQGRQKQDTAAACAVLEELAHFKRK